MELKINVHLAERPAVVAHGHRVQAAEEAELLTGALPLMRSAVQAVGLDS